MSLLEKLLRAMETIWPELPDLVGKDWPGFADQLTGYLRQLKEEPAQEPIICALILALFAQHPEAHQRLVEVIAAQENQEPLMTRGLREFFTHGTPVTSVTRYTDIACPRRVWVETPRVSVVVRLTVQRQEFSAAVEELRLRADLPVRVRVEAAGFDVLNEPEQETAILPGKDSPALVFDLRPRQIGPTRANFDFFQADNPVGTASVPVEITAFEVSAVSEPRPGQALRTDIQSPSPDYMLFIAFERFQEQPALVFTLFRAGEVGRTFHPVPLQGDPLTHAARLYEQITDLTDSVEPTIKLILGKERRLPAEDVDRQLKKFGQNLWHDLIPEDLKAVYAAEREAWRDKAVLIVSDEPYIPWELVWPYAPGGWEAEAPWCLTLRLTRWLRRDVQGNGHEAAPTRLSLKTIACLAPTYKEFNKLPSAQRELAFLHKLMAQHHLSDLSPTPPTWSKVLDLLEAGGYDWLHVAAHGNFYPNTPDADSAIWLEGDRPLTPDALVGPAIEGHINSHRPGFVFNACETGRQGWTLTRLGGWANKLVSAGAGLFLAPMWTVTDDRALAFAKTLYLKLLAGETVAEAVRQARLAAKSSGDPTWLAYSIYAHPNARVLPEPPPQP